MKRFGTIGFGVQVRGVEPVGYHCPFDLCSQKLRKAFIDNWAELRDGAKHGPETAKGQLVRDKHFGPISTCIIQYRSRELFSISQVKYSGIGDN